MYHNKSCTVSNQFINSLYSAHRTALVLRLKNEHLLKRLMNSLYAAIIAT